LSPMLDVPQAGVAGPGIGLAGRYLAAGLDAGKTIHEAIAARPTTDVAAVRTNGRFTGGMITRIAYGSLAKPRRAIDRRPPREVAGRTLCAGNHRKMVPAGPAAARARPGAGRTREEHGVRSVLDGCLVIA
jgi:hypothetical protein